jgi:ubiquinone/menaquinone biosynthesis C-methylase UbiE
MLDRLVNVPTPAAARGPQRRAPAREALRRRTSSHRAAFLQGNGVAEAPGSGAAARTGPPIPLQPGADRPPDFGSLVHEYKRFRRGYSSELFDLVIAQSPRPRPRVLDIASGTGLSAEFMLPHAFRFVATDVALGMLSQNPASARVLAKAEALPFRDRAFDLVTCAQAFHWLDPPRALAEMHRVLDRDGVGVIWWKYESPEAETTRVVDEVVFEAVHEPARHTDMARGTIPFPAPAPFRAVEERWLPLRVEYTVDSYVGYQASRENLRQQLGAKREDVLREIRRRLTETYGSKPFSLPYRQRIEILRK